MNYKKELVEYAHMLEEKGFVTAMGGNISILDRENNKLYITPTQTRKLTLTEDQIAVLDFDTEEQLEGSLKPSSEYRLHKAAYLARPDCCGAVHCHSHYLTAYAIQNKNIKIDSQTSFAAVKGEIKCIPYGMPGTTHIADGLDEAIKDRNIALLGNHGSITVGKDICAAFLLLEEMEWEVKTYTISRLFGTPEPIPGFEDFVKKMFG